MVIVAVSALIFLSALAVGVNDAMIRNSVALFSGHISVYGLPAAVGPEKLVVEGVQGILKRVPVRGEVCAGGRCEDLTLVGVNPTEEQKHTALGKRLVQGEYPAAGEKSLLLSQSVAERLRLRVGGEAEFRPASRSAAIPLRLSGIYRTGMDPLDHGLAFCPIEALDSRSGPWWGAVFLREGVDPEPILDRYGRILPDGVTLRSWKEMMPDLVQLIDLNYVSMSIVMVLVFGVVSLGIISIFTLFILKSLREYGILKAMGVTPGEMTTLISSEVFLMVAAASLLGIGLGAAAVAVFSQTGIDLTSFTSQNRYFSISGVIHPRLTSYSLFLPPALATIFGLLSAVWPVALVVRKRSADILRMV